MTGRYRGILASAGTGKTYALTTQLLARFLAGEDPSSIFAATFTRTAAGEILDRILRRLCAAARGGEGLADLKRAVEREDLTADDALAALGTLGRSLDRVSIWTLDAFLVRVATAFAVEIGLPPGWRITGDDEDAQLRDAAIARVLRDGGKDAILPLLRMLKKSEGERSVRESLLGSVNAVHALHMACGDSAWEHVRPIAGLLDDEQIAATVDAAQRAPLAMTKGGRPHARWVTAHQKLMDLVLRKAWGPLAENGYAASALAGGTYYGLEFPEELREVLARLAQHGRAFITGELLKQNEAARQLAERFESAYGDLKQERGAIRFDDLPRLIMNEDLATVREELYYRLDARIRHVLLDEFQDTSVAQFRVLEPMLAEIVSDETQERTLFYVGDPKQSLFGWRDAEPALISRMGEWWPQIQTQKLARSYRSAPEVLRAVNTVFSDLSSLDVMQAESAHRAAREWDDLFTLHTWAPKLEKTPGRVEVREFPDLAPEGAKSGEDPVRWCRHVVERVKEITRISPGATVGVLLRRKIYMPRLLAMLADAGIDAAEEGGSPLTQAPAVAAVLSLLQMAEHPGDTLSAFHAASTALGELVGLSGSITPGSVEAVAREIRARITRDGLASFVESCARWLIPATNAMNQTRLRQLVECAVAYDRRGGIGVRGFIELVDATKRPSGVPARVRVMTIHAAKGLEFDAVLVPELDQKIPARPPEVVYSRNSIKGPITAISIYANKSHQEASPELLELVTEREARETREALCLLYVAMTRARRYLELIVKQVKPAAQEKSDEPERFTLGKLVRARLTAPGCEGPLLAASGEAAWQIGLGEDGPSEDRSTAPEPREVVVGLAKAAPLARVTASDHAEEAVDGSVEGRAALDGLVPVLDHRQEEVEAITVDAVERESRRRMARGLGTAVHACLERYEWLDVQPPPSDDDLRDVLAGLALPFELEVDHVIATVRKVLGHEHVRRLLMCETYARAAGDSVELRRELAGVLRPPAQGDIDRQTRARVDRVVITRRGGSIEQVEIIDWKTDGISSPSVVDAATEAARAEVYMGQMHAYRNLVASALGVDPARVHARLVMVASGRILEA